MAKEQKVKPVDLVEVKWLEGDKFHKAGSTSMFHKVQAEKLSKAKKAEVVKGGKTEMVDISNTKQPEGD